jgi:hypothetical protein
MKKFWGKHKRITLACLFIALVVALNSFLDFALTQPGLSRTMFYEAKKQDYECLVLGASHGSYGIDAYTLGDELGMQVMSMCMGGEYMYDAYHVLRYALSKKNDDIKMVILDIDYQYFMNQHDESILFNTVYNAYPNEWTKLSYFTEKMLKEEYRGTFLQWTNYWQCYKYIGKTIKKKTSSEYRHYSSSVVEMNANDKYMGRGFIYRNRNEKKSTVSCLDWDDDKLDENQEKYIEKIVKLCRENDIDIVFTTIAQDPDTVKEKIDSFTKADNYIRTIANNLGVEYYNFNKMYQAYFERSADDFYDREGHMYGDVAERFSKIYGQVIRESFDGGIQNNYFATDLKEIYGRANE